MIGPGPVEEFDLRKLLQTVFEPQPGEKALVLCDVPHRLIADNPVWAERRRMAEEWRAGFEQIGVPTFPLLEYPATGSHNADLPEEGYLDGRPVGLTDYVRKANLVVAMTEFSATAPLSRLVRPGVGGLRVASMPGVSREMEQTALAADYRVVAARAWRLRDLLNEADAAEVVFGTGDQALFDLRFRQGRADDGLCTPQKDFPIINLPSGEAYQVPYEGDQGEPSKTSGTLPMVRAGTLLRLKVEQNQISGIEGTGPVADSLRAYFDIDPARRNIAEFGLGCNPWARVRGNVLEDERTGFHWAYGRSDHLGGTVGPATFLKPEYVVHRDEVYSEGTPIGIRRISLWRAGGGRTLIMADNRYLVFS